MRALNEARVLEGFYLAGDTGLALQFGHRLSLDLDFFAPEHFDEEALLQRIQTLTGFALVAKAPYTLRATVGGTKISFLGYAYPLLAPTSSFEEVTVADLHDIACMKVSALSGRGAKRDFVDVYACAQHDGLKEILRLFARKFAQANYSMVHILKSLTLFHRRGERPHAAHAGSLGMEQGEAVLCGGSASAALSGCPLLRRLINL